MADVKPKRRYFDYAATSFPKPPAVIEAMSRYATQLGASPGRGAYAEVVATARLVEQCRDRIRRLVNGASSDHIVFTLNATDALNLAIKGIAQHYNRRGERVHLVTTWLDHNSILRPYNALRLDGVEITHVPVDPATGIVDPDDVRKAIRDDTRLVATIHGSNVTGTIQDIAAIGAICRAADVPLLVDAAQTLGHLPIDMQAMHIDLLAFPGHKGLLGPLGTGGLAFRPGVEQIVDTIREGGTGSISEQDVQPDFMPDKYECGSHNAIGIIGLSEGVKWILEQGVDNLWQHELQLIGHMLDGLRELPGLRLLGPPTTKNRCGVFSILIDGLDPTELATILEDHYGVLTRPGIHCAPLAHQAFRTHVGGGATRLSVGPFLTSDDVKAATQAIAEICHAQAEVSGVPGVSSA
jgi:cysteine desulfurase family protein